MQSALAHKWTCRDDPCFCRTSNRTITWNKDKILLNVTFWTKHLITSNNELELSHTEVYLELSTLYEVYIEEQQKDVINI